MMLGFFTFQIEIYAIFFEQNAKDHLKMPQ
jgi:hypothetical protein